MSLIAKDFGGIERSVLCDESGRLVTGGLSEYGFDKFDDAITTTTTAYVGFIRTDGGWYIMKFNTSGIMQAEYAKGDASYTTNWNNRVSITYGYYNAIFGV